MQIVKNCVLLLKADKSEDTEDKYETTLKGHGFQVKHIKTLDFLYSNIGLLQKKLEQENYYNGIVFTTPRTVRALVQALGNKTSVLSQWYGKTNYVVGETTHELVRKDLGFNCSGQETGNAKNLAELIIKDKHNISKPLLLPCGNLANDTLSNRLKEAGIAVEPVIVYETVTSNSLNTDLSETTAQFRNIPEYWVYFSPSGVNGTVELVQKLSGASNLIKFIAIGPTTESALKGKGVPVKSVALRPTPEELLKAILS